MSTSNSEPLPQTRMAEGPIILQVGERRFVTTKATLTEESLYFASLFSGRWENELFDEAHFIDADGAVFEHVLCYLRHGTFPIFYDQTKGHDHRFYQLLLEQARYFQINLLENWLSQKKYLNAVNFSYTIKKLEDLYVPQTLNANTDVRIYPEWITEKEYVCPRGLYMHKIPEHCGRICRRVQGDAEDEYKDKEVLKIVMVTKEMLFNQPIRELIAEVD